MILFPSALPFLPRPLLSDEASCCGVSCPWRDPRGKGRGVTLASRSPSGLFPQSCERLILSHHVSLEADARPVEP